MAYGSEENVCGMKLLLLVVVRASYGTLSWVLSVKNKGKLKKEEEEEEARGSLSVSERVRGLATLASLQCNCQNDEFSSVCIPNGRNGLPKIRLLPLRPL